jgi:two-component system, chemotaxis family, protein-glutamate methylesterase/glutaminase
VDHIVVMGASLGGLKALETVLADLPADFPMAIAIVQHRKADAEQTLATLLGKRCVLPVSEADDKQEIRPGHIYLAPSEYHLLVEKDHFALSLEEPVNFARPSVDVLFESAAETYGTGVIGVIMTGTGRDGAWGLAAIKEHGGLTVVQDIATAEGDGMPKAALAASTVDRILPLERIGPFLVETCCAEREKGTGPICRNGPQAGTDAQCWSSHKLDLSPFPASGIAE